MFFIFVIFIGLFGWQISSSWSSRSIILPENEGGSNFFLLNFFNILYVWSRLTVTFCKISGVIDVAWKWTVLTQLNNQRQRQSHSFIAIQKKRLLLPTHVYLSYLYLLRVGVWFYVELTWGRLKAWVTCVLLLVTAGRYVFWNVTPCSVVEVYRCLRGMYYLHR